MASKTTGERLTEDKLIKAAKFEADKNKPKKRGRKKTITSDELTDAMPVRITRRSTIRGYKGTNVFVPATQAGVYHSNLVMGELLKQVLTAYAENLIGFGAGRVKPSDLLDLARATDIACKITERATETGNTKLPKLPDNEKSIFRKFFGAVGEIAKAGEKEFDEVEFENQLQKVEEASDNVEEVTEEFIEKEQKWRSENVKAASDCCYEELGNEGIQEMVEEADRPREPIDKEARKAGLKAQREYFDEIREEGAEVIAPEGYHHLEEDKE